MKLVDEVEDVLLLGIPCIEDFQTASQPNQELLADEENVVGSGSSCGQKHGAPEASVV